MTLDDKAAPTKPCACAGSWRKRVSSGISPSAPSLICCVMVRAFQSQKVSVSPYALGTSAGLKPCKRPNPLVLGNGLGFSQISSVCACAPYAQKPCSIQTETCVHHPLKPRPTICPTKLVLQVRASSAAGGRQFICTSCCPLAGEASLSVLEGQQALIGMG